MGSDCISSWSLLIFLLCISELLWLCHVVALKSLPVHSFNALIIPILRGCLQSLFNIADPWYLFDTVLKVISWPALVSRCRTDAYFSFYWLVLDIDMNRGCKLYRSFYQMDLTYAIDCLLNSITGMNVAFLLTVSPPYTQLPLAKRNAYFPFIQDSFLDRCLFIWTPFWFISVFESTAYLKFAKLQYVSSGFRCQVITGLLMRLY